jgi:hypothetical protein
MVSTAAMTKFVEFRARSDGLDRLRVSRESSDQTLEGSWSKAIVVVEEKDELGRHGGETLIPGSGTLGVRDQSETPHSRICGGSRRQILRGPVRGGIVDDNEFPPVERLPPNAFDCLTEQIAAVPGRDDDLDLRTSHLVSSRAFGSKTRRG